MDTKQQIKYLFDAGISQRDIADEIGITQPYVSQIIGGKRLGDLRYSVAIKLKTMVMRQQRKNKRKEAA